MRKSCIWLALALFTTVALAQDAAPAAVNPLRVSLGLDQSLGGKPLAQAEWFAPGAFVPGKTISAGGVDFVLGTNFLDVSISMSGLKEIARVKSYLDGKWANSSNRCVMKIPGDQYQALYLLAFSRKTADAVPRMTVRIGMFGGMSGVLQDEVVQVPDLLEGGAAPNIVAQLPVILATGKQGTVSVIRVPLDGSGNVREGIRDLEFTRDMQPRVNLPDPNEFGELPLGHPSGVVVLGAVLERSPIAMTHDSPEAGNVFNEPVKPVFQVSLSNRTDKAIESVVTAACEGPGTIEEGIPNRAPWMVSETVPLKPGEARTVTLNVQPPSKLRGWYACSLTVKAGGVPLQRRDTTFAVLAPDTRKAFDESPFGVWEFWRPHSVFIRPDQGDKLASLMKKGGWRWTYGGSPTAVIEGVTNGTPEYYKALFAKYGFRMTIQSLKNSYQRGEGWYDEAQFASNDAPGVLAHKARGYDNAIKVLHESRSSTALLRRFSEFLGGDEYVMPPEEKAKLDTQFENVKKYCAAIKKVDPQAKIVLINDYPHVAIEYLRRGFPAELFDVVGLECAGFMREPERQPDWLSVLGHAEMMRRAFKKYGYDKPMWTTEALYHATNPGNLSFHAQGVLAVREHLIALANGFKKLAAAGIIKDPSDDYHWSNWGASGYCFRDPEINPKPSFAMIAWLTQVLDQAAFNKVVETGSTALYLLDFKRPDGGHVYPAWVVRGSQKAVIQVASGKPVVRDVYGNALAVPFVDGKLEVTLSDTPIYITGAEVAAVASREPVELPAKTGAMLVDFADPAQMRTVAVTNPILERNWDFPRIKGDFETAFETVDGATALKVSLKPDGDGRKLFQRYVEFALVKPIVLDGQPDAFNVRVKGNGGWGRIMFELVDAKGRIWTSCGNQYAGSCNASDNRGDSFISFEGWQTMRIPLVRQYEGSDQSVMNPATPDWWPENTPELPAMEAKFKANMAAYETALAEMPAKQAAHAEALKAYEEKRKTLPKKDLRGLKAPTPPAEPAKPGFRWMGIAGVDYPVRLTKITVAMPPNILYGIGERPVEKPVIWIDKLTY